MIPAPFDYVRAGSPDEAVATLAEAGSDARLLAGGHSLLPLMRLRLARPALLVDVGRIRDLSFVRDGGDHIAVGALTTHDEVASSDLVRQAAPLLGHVAGQVGDPQVRHRGTIGGTLAHGDPASDVPAALVALRASVTVRGAGGSRTVPVDGLYRGFLETALSPDEMVTEVLVPKAAGAGWSFQKFNRRAQDWAVVACAVVTNGSAGVGLVNMGTTTLRGSAVEQALAGGASDTDAAALAADGTEPPDDLNADPEFRRHLARVLVGRALAEARHRQRPEGPGAGGPSN